MNNEARMCLTRAASHLAKGEGSYRKAAAEMQAAKEAGATWTEIGDTLGRSRSWCERIVAWSRTPASSASSTTPWEDNRQVDHRKTRRVLRDAPLEQVESLINDLPPERQQAIAAAAGHAYSKARREHDEAEAQLTPEQRREREEARERLSRSSRQATGTFAALGIVGHIEQATEELHELTADASLTPEAAKKIERALEVFTREFEFAKQLLGGE